MKLYGTIFYTHNLDEIINFYESVVGLPKAIRQGLTYAAFKLSNQAEIGIKVASETREVPGQQTAMIALDNIEDFYSKLAASNVVIDEELKKYDWGTSFSILDPDGNKLEFISDI